MGKLIHCLRYDLREGTVKMWPLYVLEAVFVAIIAVNELIPMKMQGFLPNVSELSVKVFEGFEKYEYVEGGKVFQIPMKYLLFTLLAGIFTVYYPRREWRLRGNMYLSRYRSKNLWWLSKCLWCAIQSFCVYLVAYAAIFAVAACMGTGGFAIREEFLPFLKAPLLISDDVLIMCYIWILGYVTLLALSQFLVLCQMCLSPVAGYVVYIAVITASAYYVKWFMMGNNFMLLRTAVFRQDGIELVFGVVFCGILWGIEVLAGNIIIRKKDVLG